MGPYRPLHVYDKKAEEASCRADDRVLAILMLVLGLARLIPALINRESAGTEVTVAGMMVVAAILIGLRR